MKVKILIISLCGFVLPMSAFAQTSVTVKHPHFPRHTQKTIIKERQGYMYATVTCSNTPEKTTFIYADEGMQSTERDLKDIFVNDMFVDKDSVYFCGKHHPTGNGIVGYFRIDKFFNNVEPAYVDTVLFAGDDGYRMDELTRITVFKDPMEIRHIISIGKTKKEKYPCIVNLLLDFNTHMYWGGCVKDADEEFTDLEIVYNREGNPYLVTAGYDTTYGRYLSIRVHDLLFFTTSNIQDWRHVYCVDTSYVRQWLDGGVLLAATEPHTFATVSYRKNAKEGDIHLKLNHTIHLGLYDIDDIITHSVYGMTDNYEMELNTTSDRLMNEFIYNKLKEIMVFLHTYTDNTTGVVSNEYCEIKPSLLSTSGTLSAYTNPDKMLFGLSIYNNRNKYILSGYDLANPDTLKYQMNTYSITSQCADPIEYKYVQHKPIVSMNALKQFNYKNTIGVPVEFGEDEMENWPLYIECEAE